jgi:hypothetical protein
MENVSDKVVETRTTHILGAIVFSIMVENTAKLENPQTTK